MAEAVAAAVESERHVVITAGTGTGKTLAYLVPVVASGRRAVVATATKGAFAVVAARIMSIDAARMNCTCPVTSCCSACAVPFAARSVGAKPCRAR